MHAAARSSVAQSIRVFAAGWRFHEAQTDVSALDVHLGEACQVLLLDRVPGPARPGGAKCLWPTQPHLGPLFGKGESPTQARHTVSTPEVRQIYVVGANSQGIAGTEDAR